MSEVTRGLSCRTEYVMTPPGILKLIETFCNLLGTILCGAGPALETDAGRKGFFLFVSIVALIITIALFIIFLINLPETCLDTDRPICDGRLWIFVEGIWLVFIILFYFIASIVIATAGSQFGIYGAAAFFGFAAFLAYIVEMAFLILRARSAGETRESSYATNQPARPPGQ